MTEKWKVLLWVLAPLIYGILTSISVSLLSPLLIQILFTVLWFWVGMKFSHLSGSKVKNFFEGNSLWLLSLLLYLWQFFLLSDETRNTFMAMFSQYYMTAFLWSGTKLSQLLCGDLDGKMITIFAYLVMFVVFVIGFLAGRRRP